MLSACYLRHAVALFRHQPFFHFCGKAKLCGFSDGFGSLRSGPQLLCLCQSLRCPGSPVVTIEIVARQFCHVIVLTAALAGRCAASRQHRTSSGRRLSAPHEQGRNWCTAGSSARIRHGLRQCDEPLCATGIWDSEAAPAARGNTVCACESGIRAPCGTTELPVTDGCQRPGGDHGTMPTRQSGALVNIDHF